MISCRSNSLKSSGVFGFCVSGSLSTPKLDMSPYCLVLFKTVINPLTVCPPARPNEVPLLPPCQPVLLPLYKPLPSAVPKLPKNFAFEASLLSVPLAILVMARFAADQFGEDFKLCDCDVPIFIIFAFFVQ